MTICIAGITSHEDFVRLIRALAKTRKIEVVECEQTESQTLLAFRTRIDKEGTVAWIVGFGPFNFLPETRQAPSVELAIRTKKKSGEMFHLLNQDPEGAHLADVPSGMTDEVMGKLWEATVKKTQEILGGEDIRSKNRAASAKITFAIPIDLWKCVNSKI